MTYEQIAKETDIEKLKALRQSLHLRLLAGGHGAKYTSAQSKFHCVSDRIKILRNPED